MSHFLKNPSKEPEDSEALSELQERNGQLENENETFKRQLNQGRQMFQKLKEEKEEACEKVESLTEELNEKQGKLFIQT